MKTLLSLDPAPSVVVIIDAGGERALVGQVQAAFPRAAIIGGCAMGRGVLVADARRSLVGSGTGILAITGWDNRKGSLWPQFKGIPECGLGLVLSQANVRKRGA